MACSGDSILTSNESAASVNDNRGTGGTVGQSFQIPNDATVCGVSINCGEGSGGGTFKVELLSGSISGTVLASTGTLNTSILLASPSGQYEKFEFVTPVALTGGTTYWIKVTHLSGGTGNVINYVRTSNVYADGNWFLNTTSYSQYDIAFRVHGVEGGGGDVFIPKCSFF